MAEVFWRANAAPAELTHAASGVGQGVTTTPACYIATLQSLFTTGRAKSREKMTLHLNSYTLTLLLFDLLPLFACYHGSSTSP